ncbi:hypothetical protein BH09GEM1_BH09GEM1_33870 [soil metagenome]
MNVSRTAALLLLATLVVGIALGALGAGALRPRLERGPPPPPPEAGPRGSGGFAEHMMSVIEPTDSAQASAVRAVVERAAARNRRIIQDLNGSLKASVDSMRAKLAPMLTPDQRDRLERAVRQLPAVRGPGGPGSRGRGGPPPQ